MTHHPPCWVCCCFAMRAASGTEMVELLSARAAGGPLVAENERLQQELRAAAAQQARLEASVRHLQQQLALAAGGEGRQARRRAEVSIERERLADAQVRPAATSQTASSLQAAQVWGAIRHAWRYCTCKRERSARG